MEGIINITSALNSQNHTNILNTNTDCDPKTMFYGLCCCCLELVSRKSLWAEYTWMGSAEVYGDMIKECFELNMSGNKSQEQICEVCITQLRNALRFKRRVVACQAQLASLYAGRQIVMEKCVNVDTKTETDGATYMEDDFIKSDSDTPVVKTECIKIEIENPSDDDDDVKLATLVSHGGRRRMKRKINPLTRGSPKKSSTKKVTCGARKSNYIRTRQNVAHILEHSTLLPFKSNKGYFNCFYCNKQHAVFNELKAHVAEKHTNVTLKCIMKCILRPDHIVKADASDLSCKICSKRIQNVQDLVQHLSQAHRVKFNYENKLKPNECILPYDLSDGKYQCCICRTEFMFFKTLSKHMNEHSTSNVCDVCGKCFLLTERLRAHKKMHTDSTAVKCEYCGRTCASNILLRSHIRYTHKKISYGCSICGEIFVSFKARIKHLEDVHGRSLLNLNCHVCGKKFMSPCSLNAHTKREHLKIPRDLKHSCNECGMRFVSTYALRCHLVVHSGEKNFECEVCHKKYGRAKTLVEHMKIHTNDRRWSCAACGQAFVQKCSLKNHVRVHHGDLDAEQLIVYKKPDE